MAISKTADRGSGSRDSTSTSTTFNITLTTGASITTGRILILRVAADNNSAANDTLTTITDPRSNTWTKMGALVGGSSTTSAGVLVGFYWAKVTNAYSNNDVVTINFSTATGAVAAIIEEWSGIDNIVPVAAGPLAASGAADTSHALPSITVPYTDQLVYCLVGTEGPSTDTFTQDSDTTNGSWVALTKVGATNGTATNNVTINGGYKIVTASGAQAYTATDSASRDWAGFVVIFDVSLTADSNYASFTTANPTSAPIVDTGHWVLCRAKASNADGASITVRLVQGASTVIESWTHSLTTSFSNYFWLLSSTNVANITDYNDLRLEVRANAGARPSTTFQVSQLYLNTPDGPPVVNVNAGLASGTGTGRGASFGLGKTPTVASGTGTANNATKTVAPTPPNAATGTGAALQPGKTIAQNISAASGTGSSNQSLAGQLMLPVADQTVTGWVTQAGGTTNLYTVIDEATADDADYVTAQVVP